MILVINFSLCILKCVSFFKHYCLKRQAFLKSLFLSMKARTWPSGFKKRNSVLHCTPECRKALQSSARHFTKNVFTLIFFSLTISIQGLLSEKSSLSLEALKYFVGNSSCRYLWAERREEKNIS